MSQKSNEQVESKPHRVFFPEKEEPDDMVFHAKSDEERMVIDLTLGLLASLPCIKGLKVLQLKSGDGAKDEYFMLSVVNLSVKPIPKDSALPWILSLTVGHGKAAAGHFKFFINKNYIFTKFLPKYSFDKSDVLAKLSELNAFLESLKEMDEPKAAALLKEKYVATFFPLAPKRASPSAPTVIVQQAPPASVEPPAKKAKTTSAVAATAPAPASKKKAPPKRTTPRRNVSASSAKSSLPLKSKEQEDSETVAKSDDESETNEREVPEKEKDASFHGSDADGDDNDDDDGDK